MINHKIYYFGIIIARLNSFYILPVNYISFCNSINNEPMQRLKHLSLIAEGYIISEIIADISTNIQNAVMMSCI